MALAVAQHNGIPCFCWIQSSEHLDRTQGTIVGAELGLYPAMNGWFPERALSFSGSSSLHGLPG